MITKQYKTIGVVALFILIVCAVFFVPLFIAEAAEAKYVPVVTLPGAGGNDTSGALAPFIKSLFNIGVTVVAILAVIMIIVGGLQYMTTDAVSGKSQGKERIRNAVFGLLIALLIITFLQTIGVNANLTLSPAQVTISPGDSLGITDGIKPSPVDQIEKKIDQCKGTGTDADKKNVEVLKKQADVAKTCAVLDALTPEIDRLLRMNNATLVAAAQRGQFDRLAIKINEAVRTPFSYDFENGKLIPKTVSTFFLSLTPDDLGLTIKYLLDNGGKVAGYTSETDPQEIRRQILAQLQPLYQQLLDLNTISISARSHAGFESKETKVRFFVEGTDSIARTADKLRAALTTWRELVGKTKDVCTAEIEKMDKVTCSQ